MKWTGFVLRKFNEKPKCKHIFIIYEVLKIKIVNHRTTE